MLKLLGKALLGNRMVPESPSITLQMSHEPQREKGNFTWARPGGNHLNQVMKFSITSNVDKWWPLTACTENGAHHQVDLLPKCL